MVTPANTEGANTFLPPCPTIQPFLTIENITQGNPCIVTVEEENTYVVGQVVTFSVPNSYNMVGINGMSGLILAISGLDFTIDINTLYFDAFIPAGSGQTISKPATLSPSGSRNLYNITTVPFHSAGNFGN